MRRRYLHWIVMAVLLGGCVAPRPPGLSSTAQPPRAEPSQTRDAPPGAPLPGLLAYLDFTNGFRDLTFGDEPTPDMQLTERKGDTTLYRRPRDELTFGGAGLRDLAYVFYKGQLLAVLLKTAGLQQTQMLREQLQDTYGAGVRADPSRQRYIWHGMRVLVVYDQRPHTDEALVVWQSLPLQHERHADQQGRREGYQR